MNVNSLYLILATGLLIAPQTGLAARAVGSADPHDWFPCKNAKADAMSQAEEACANLGQSMGVSHMGECAVVPQSWTSNLGYGTTETVYYQIEAVTLTYGCSGGAH